MLERCFELPLGFETQFSQTPGDGVCELRHRRNLLRLEDRTTPREKHPLVELDDDTRINACSSEEALSFRLICLCALTAVNGWVYMQKTADVRYHDDVRSTLDDYDLQALDAFARHDRSAGYMYPETFWNWACLFGGTDGLRAGLNLSCGVNEISFTENCYWLDGELLEVDNVRFDLDRDQPLRP